MYSSISIFTISVLKLSGKIHNDENIIQIVKSRHIYHMSAERAHKYKVPKGMPDIEKSDVIWLRQ